MSIDDLYEQWPNEAECLQLKKALHRASTWRRSSSPSGAGRGWSSWPGCYWKESFELALWRSTGAVHAIVDGAVVEKPLVPAAWEPA